MKKIAVFISGRGSNFIQIDAAIKSGAISNAKIVAVCSDNKDAAGLKYATENSIDIIILDPKSFASRDEHNQAIIDSLEKYNIDLICLAGYMRIVGDRLIERYKNKIINIHPSLLPSFKGLHAQRQALEYGVKYSGCTVHFVDIGVDTGAIIMQSVVEVSANDNEETLSEKILKQEHIIYPAVVELFCNDKIQVTDRIVTIFKELNFGR